MANGTWTTTPDEDAAILALKLDESVPAFIDRHIRHQVSFAVYQQTTALSLKAYASATPEDRAAVDAILSKTKGQR